MNKTVLALANFEAQPDGSITLTICSNVLKEAKFIQATLPARGTQDQIGQITGLEVGKPAIDILDLHEALKWLYGLEA